MAEANYRHAHPAFRVFIFGMEVTKDVISVVCQRTDGRAPATASITLVSPNDRYVANSGDVKDIYNVSKIKRENVDIDGFDISSYIDLSTQDPIKSTIIREKVKVPPIKINLPTTLPSSSVISAITERYPFQSGLSIFHPMDPVRVFERDPFDPTKWYYMFTGFVSDFTESVGSNQDKLVTIVAEDPSKLLRYSRFTSNPGVFDISKQKVIDAITADIADFSVFASLFNGRTLAEIFYHMLFGDSAEASKISASEVLNETIVSVNGSQSIKRRRWGVGHTSLDNSCVYLHGTDTSSGNVSGIPGNLKHKSIKNDLGAYQADIDHLVKLDDVDTLRLTAEFGPDKYVPPDIKTINDVILEIGGHPEVYPVDGGRLAILMPASLGADNRELVTHELIGQIALNTEWTTRAEVLYEIIDNIEFIFYVSPKGDYIVEFPLFDFEPEDFGNYAKYYNVSIGNTCNIETAFSDTKVHTQASVGWQIAQNWEKVSSSLYTINREFVTLWHLIPLYGVRSMPMTTKGYLASAGAAKLYGNISLNRMNADAFTQKVTAIPNLQMWLNRPIRVNARDHIGTAKSITHSLTWGQAGDMSTELGLYAMRSWDGSMQGDKKVYWPIGGRGSRPLNYATLYARPEVTKDTPWQPVIVTTGAD